MDTPLPAAEVGRHVLYTIPAGPRAGETRPAVITKAWSPTCANLHVWHDAEDVKTSQQLPEFFTITPTSVDLHQPADGVRPMPGTWRWMPYQVEQAALDAGATAEARPGGGTIAGGGPVD